MEVTIRNKQDIELDFDVEDESVSSDFLKRYAQEIFSHPEVFNLKRREELIFSYQLGCISLFKLFKMMTSKDDLKCLVHFFKPPSKPRTWQQ